MKAIGNQIKAELAKALNVKASDFACTVKGSVRITIKNPTISFEAVKAITNKYESVRYCDATGDMLEGGNTFVFINYDWNLRQEMSKADPENLAKMEGRFYDPRFG